MSQTSQIVAHPDTGQPVKQVTTVDFQEVEKTQLETEVANASSLVNDKKAQAGAKQAELDLANKELAEAEAALADAKSNVETYDNLTPEQPATGAEAASGEGAPADAQGETSVPVEVKPNEPQF